MQTAIFPMKVLRFSAIWKTSTPHKKCSGFGYKTTNYKDYPTDLVGADTGKDWVYAPCDLICTKVYNKASHGLWFRSTSKVKTPSGEKWLYIMAEHMSTSGFKVGKKYKQGAKLFTENMFGNATGNHIHWSMGISDKPYNGGFWTKNNHGAWVLRISGVTNVKINEALYVDTSFTTIKDTRMTFKKVSDVTDNTEYKVGETYTLQEDMNIRIGHSTSSAKVSASKWSKDAQKHKTSGGLLAKGTKVTCKDVYSSGSETWIKTPSGWICAKGKRVYIK